MKTEKLIELIYRTMPYSEQIEDLDILESGDVDFVWRGHCFNVSKKSLLTMEVDKERGIQSGGAMPILVTAMLKRCWMTKDGDGWGLND